MCSYFQVRVCACKPRCRRLIFSSTHVAGADLVAGGLLDLQCACLYFQAPRFAHVCARKCQCFHRHFNFFPSYFLPTCTVVQISQELGCEHWVTCKSCILCCTYSFACSLTYSPACGKVNDKMSQNDLVLSHRVLGVSAMHMCVRVHVFLSTLSLCRTCCLLSLESQFQTHACVHVRMCMSLSLSILSLHCTYCLLSPESQFSVCVCACAHVRVIVFVNTFTWSHVLSSILEVSAAERLKDSLACLSFILH